MQTTQLKKFAVESRNILKEGVASRLINLGFDKDGNATIVPEKIEGGTVWNGQILLASFFDRWQSLKERIDDIGIKEVIEEGAYTWFNRLVAIKILSVNELIEPILKFSEGTHIPFILEEAEQHHIDSRISEDKKRRLFKLLESPRTFNEAFALLIAEFCSHNFILHTSFGSIADYTELLLPENILQEGGFIESLNNLGGISEEDYKSPELIGWLYQFYISERKDEVMKKNTYRPEEIPAATQIFTPNWIVKYMVQNTLGRIYLDGLRDKEEKEEWEKKWKYLVDNNGSQENRDGNNPVAVKRVKPRNLKVADLSCGSGHILNEFFDMLYDFYMESGTSPSEAIDHIFNDNLTGVDIDDRACQLSRFALLLKAAQKDKTVIDRQIYPHIVGMPHRIKGSINDALHFFFKGDETPEIMKEMAEVFTLLKDADSLGSIMKFDISRDTRYLIQQRLEYWKTQSVVPEEVSKLFPSLDLMLTLTETYDALVTNPPYMVPGKNDILGKYSKKNYPNSYSDMATIFIEVMADRSKDGGDFAFIIPPSWMFLSGFQKFRKEIIDNYSIQSLLHLSRGVFGADFGASSAVIKKAKNGDFKGTYFRLIERTFQEFDQRHLKELFEKVLENHEFKYLFKNYSKGIESIEYSEDGAKIYYDKVNQKQFEQIPGSPIAYWVSENFISKFEVSLESVILTREGLSPADMDRFIRYWYEIDFINKLNIKWFPYQKGGTFRKWNGNQEYVVNWENDGYEIKNNIDPSSGRIRSHNYNGEFAFREGFTWNAISSTKGSFRYVPKGFLFDSAGSMGFSRDNKLHYSIGILNSKIGEYALSFISPTIKFMPGQVTQVPYVESNDFYNIEKFVLNNISISRQDWDAHETSWDFSTNELVRIKNEELRIKNIKETVNEYKDQWTRLFSQLHRNEEELNRQFIDIYGLQDELTPDVPLDEITILQQGEIKIEDDKIQWQDDVLMKQLISYAIGVWFGRYRLDKPGLNIAHPNPTAEELASYEYNGETVEIDDDAIIPILPLDAPFEDNAAKRIIDFIRIVWGAEDLNENINFLESSLGMPVEDYFDRTTTSGNKKGFWGEHLAMYSKLPIYWMFSSNKGAFKCLVYMHRMTPATVKRVRENYLLKYIEWLKGTIAEMSERESSLNTSDKKKLDKMRKALQECLDYDDEIQRFADQAIEIDLDNGIAKNYALFAPILAKIK